MASLDLDDLLNEFAGLPTTSTPAKSASGDRASMQRPSATLAYPGALRPSVPTPSIRGGQLDTPDGRVGSGGGFTGQRNTSNTSNSAPHLGIQSRHHHSSSMSMPTQAIMEPGRPARRSDTSSTTLMVRQASLEELLHDLDVPSADTSPQQQSRMSNRQSSIGQMPTSTCKCMGLYLGGAAAARGRNGADIGVILCCDALRCTKCDFKVIVFHHKGWHASCDYLFFRNNYPTELKLRPLMETVQGTCAYCCQCSWRSVSSGEGVRVNSYASDLRWICGGHEG